jgi:hypothetical protein
MGWQSVNDYYAVNGDWTMTINGKKEAGNLKFALLQNGVFRAVCGTQKEAVEKHKQLTKGNK